MPQKTSLLFDVTTDPTQAGDASPHSGGWSESHWSSNFDPATTHFLGALASARAPLLPQEAQIIGWRIERFGITGNKLLPQGAQSGRFLYPGVNGALMNLPQDTLMISTTAAGNINTARFGIRCIPDAQISRGEYQPTNTYKSAVAYYLQVLKNDLWGFIGRNRAAASARVMGIAGGVVFLDGNVGGVANASFLRLNRVYDVNGNPVKGSFPITNINIASYTVTGLAGRSVVEPSGTARIDGLMYLSYGDLQVQRAVVRKIGRPFEQYRGRASTARV